MSVDLGQILPMLALVALIVVAMTLLTTPIGVRLAHGLDGKWLKQAFAAFVLVMALNMIRKAILG